MAGLLDFPLPHRCPESLQVVGWGNRRAHPICFLSCRDNDSSWPDAQCLENHFFSVYLAQYFRRRQWHTTPVLLPGKSHGRRSLVRCSPWGRWGSDTTEWLHFHFSLSWIGEGNGNPLQCSCLEDPRDWGAWWASVYEVTQSRTRLKWLSSSSSSPVFY